MLFEKNSNNEGKVASTLGKVFALLSQVGLEVTPPICKWDSALFAKFFIGRVLRFQCWGWGFCLFRNLKTFWDSVLIFFFFN